MGFSKAQYWDWTDDDDDAAADAPAEKETPLSRGVATFLVPTARRLLMRPEFQMEKRPLGDGAQWGVKGPLEAFLVMFGRRIIRDVMMGRYPADHVQLAGPCRTPGFSGAWVSLLFLFDLFSKKKGKLKIRIFQKKTYFPDFPGKSRNKRLGPKSVCLLVRFGVFLQH